MFLRGFTTTQLGLMTIAAAVALFISVPADAQEVQPAMAGTITAAPGVVLLPNSGLNVFRPNTFVGAVVTFPRPEGSNVDWAALRAGRLAAIAVEAADNVHFEFDSATLAEGSGDALVAFAGLLVANPDVNVAVEGHTDSVGEPAYNLALSLRRAESVRRALTSAGLGAERIDVVAYGEGALLRERALPSEQVENRRVEFHLIDSFTGNRIN